MKEKKCKNSLFIENKIYNFQKYFFFKIPDINNDTHSNKTSVNNDIFRHKHFYSSTYLSV